MKRRGEMHMNERNQNLRYAIRDMRYAIRLLVTIIGILFLLTSYSGQAQEKSIYQDKAYANKVRKRIKWLKDETLEKKVFKALEILNDKTVVNELLKLWNMKVIDPWDFDVDVLAKIGEETIHKAFEGFSAEEIAKITKDTVLVVKIATVAPESSPWYNYTMATIVPDIRRWVGHLGKIKLYPGGLMGDEADTIRKMRMKQLHGVAVTNMGLTMMIPELCVLGLPFLFDWEPELYYSGKHCEVDYILEKLENSIAKLAKKRGLQFIGSVETGFNAITSQFPIKSVEDFRKLKIWVWRGDRIRPEINRVFGFRKTTSTELYNVAQMLSTGMVDASAVAWYVSIVLQWWPHVKYATDYPVYGYESSSLFLDKRVVDRLALFSKWGPILGFKESTQEFARYGLELMDKGLTNMRFFVRQEEAKARKELIRRRAIQEVHFPEAELEKLRQKILPLYDKLADKLYPRWLLDEILKYRQEYRELKAAGKLTNDWYERGIIPDGDQCDQWRTEWEM